MHQTCWQSGGMFIFQRSALTHCASGQPLWPVWCVRSYRAFLSPRSPLIPGEHVRWNSPPIKTGISQVHCGNRPSVGKQRVCPSLLPSATQPHSHSLLFIKLPPSPVFLTLTVTLPPPFSHPIFSLSLTFSFYTFQFVSFEPHFQKSIFHSFSSYLFNYAHWPPLFFLLFIPFSPHFF